MEDLIMNAHILYDERHTNHPSPPLPPTPAGEPIPYFAYGSKSTKVASMPPTSTSITTSGPYPPSSPQDFTPRLPPRPANSIHPSLRTHPASPTRGRADASSPPSQLRQRDKSSLDESPPPSPSITSTVYETDDSSHEQAGDRFTTPTTEVAEALRHNDALPPV